MDRFVNEVYKNIRKDALIQPHAHVILGVSGGADSVCLLYVLLALREVMQLQLTVVHVHHGLRGVHADADQAYVVGLCEKEGVPCHCFQTDIRQMAKEGHLSEEEAGRNYRYTCFEQVRRECRGDVIAVAHHRDDRVETVLMNLFRGSAIRGLVGIPAKRGCIVRPLLHMGRSDIELYLAQRQITYQTDATNLTPDYTRNKVRLELLPYIQTHINSGAGKHIDETAMLAADLCSYVEKQAQSVKQLVMQQVMQQVAVGCEFDVDLFLQQDVVIQRELIRQAMGETAGSVKDIGLIHIETVRDLFGKSVGKKIELPYEMIAERTYQSVVIKKVQTMPDAGDYLSENAVIGGVTEASGKSFECHKIIFDKKMQIPKKMYTKWFDYDKIKDGLVFRHRQEGDYIMLHDGAKKQLRRVLMDAKVPKDERDQLILLADGSHIMWIPALGRISDDYKVTDKTTHILTAELRENRRDERKY